MLGKTFSGEWQVPTQSFIFCYLRSAIPRSEHWWLIKEKFMSHGAIILIRKTGTTCKWKHEEEEWRRTNLKNADLRDSLNVVVKDICLWTELKHRCKGGFGNGEQGQRKLMLGYIWIIIIIIIKNYKSQGVRPGRVVGHEQDSVNLSRHQSVPENECYGERKPCTHSKIYLNHNQLVYLPFFHVLLDVWGLVIHRRGVGFGIPLEGWIAH